jgi:hypothetical protein
MQQPAFADGSQPRLWLDGAERTNQDEVRALIGSGQLATSPLRGSRDRAER